MERLLAIGRFARLTHLSLKALRLYDRRGLLAPAMVDVHTGRRYYRRDQVPAARLIRRLRLLELPLDEIGALLAAQEAGSAGRLLERHRQRIEGWLAADRQTLQALHLLTVEWEHRSEEGSMEIKARPAYRCSFCGKAQQEAELLIANAGKHGESRVCICRGCVAICNEMIAAHEHQAARA